MTVTEAPPQPESSPLPATAETPDPGEGLFAVVGTGDHKVIGRFYIVASLVFGVFALVLGAMIGFERVNTTGIDVFTGADTFFQQVALYRVSLAFLFVVPLFLGIAFVIVPLQIGAASIAFPRAAAASFWVWLVSGGIHIAAVLGDGGLVGGGLDEMIELSLLSLMGVLSALLLATVCVMTTVLTQRTDGMGLRDIPLFSWSMLTAGGMWLLTLPVLFANTLMLWIDVRGSAAALFETGFFAGTRFQLGAWRYLSWAFEQPQVFAYAIPLLGILGDLLPVSARRRQTHYGIMQAAIGAFAILTFGAYAQEAFNVEVQSTAVFVVQSLALVLPVLALLGGWLAVMRRGVSLSAHFALALAGLVMFLAGGAAAAVRVLGSGIGGLRVFGRDDRDWQDGLDDFLDPLEDLAGTSIESAVGNYVLLGAAIAGIAGLVFWAPKIFGRLANGGLAYFTALALLGGTVLYALPDVISGFTDQPDNPYVGAVDSGVEALNTISAIGAVLVVGGLLLSILLIAHAGFRGAAADDNPWGGWTLEWATASPPEPGNFPDGVPEVTDEAPLSDAEEEA